MCYFMLVFMFYFLLGILMYLIFLLLLCFEKIVKDGYLQVFRYFIFNCFFVVFKSLYKKIEYIKVFDGEWNVNIDVRWYMRFNCICKFL